jgi:hypothetical protein
MIAGARSEGATDENIASRETEMKVRITQFIYGEYPGYIWTVRVDLSGKYKGAAIALPVLMPPNTYEVVPARYLCTENDMRRHSLDAAGRILERYNVPRSSIKWAEVPFLEARAKADVFNTRRKAIVPA